MAEKHIQNRGASSRSQIVNLSTIGNLSTLLLSHIKKVTPCYYHSKKVPIWRGRTAISISKPKSWSLITVANRNRGASSRSQIVNLSTLARHACPSPAYTDILPRLLQYCLGCSYLPWFFLYQQHKQLTNQIKSNNANHLLSPHS